MHIVFSSNFIKKDISKKPGTPTSKLYHQVIYGESHSVCLQGKILPVVTEHHIQIGVGVGDKVGQRTCPCT